MKNKRLHFNFNNLIIHVQKLTKSDKGFLFRILFNILTLGVSEYKK